MNVFDILFRHEQEVKTLPTMEYLTSNLSQKETKWQLLLDLDLCAFSTTIHKFFVKGVRTPELNITVQDLDKVNFRLNPGVHYEGYYI